MGSVLTGFAVVFIIIAVGFLLGHTQVLGKNARVSMGLFVYYVATPALLFDRLIHTDPAEIFSANFLVVSLSALVIGALFFVLSMLVLKRRAPESVIGMLAASYANGGNLGIPLAAYVLDDAAVVIPLILFQVALYAPISMTVLDLMQAERTSLVRNLIVAPLTNMMLLSAITGIIVSLSGITLPVFIEEPVSILAGSAVPVALVVFGLSLAGARVLQKGEVARRDVFVAVAFKNILHPIVAGALAVAFGLEGPALLAAVVLGALPTAQNVYTYALRFRTAETLARDTGVVSTLFSFPVLIIISVLLG